MGKVHNHGATATLAPRKVATIRADLSNNYTVECGGIYYAAYTLAGAKASATQHTYATGNVSTVTLNGVVVGHAHYSGKMLRCTYRKVA